MGNEVKRMRLECGQRFRLSAQVYRGSKNIEIHRSSLDHFPNLLEKGSIGEIVSNNGRELFLKVMLRAPDRWEQDFLADNTVYFKVSLSMAHILEL